MTWIPKTLEKCYLWETENMRWTVVNWDHEPNSKVSLFSKSLWNILKLCEECGILETRYVIFFKCLSKWPHQAIAAERRIVSLGWVANDCPMKNWNNQKNKNYKKQLIKKVGKHQPYWKQISSFRLFCLQLKFTYWMSWKSHFSPLQVHMQQNED